MQHLTVTDQELETYPYQAPTYAVLSAIAVAGAAVLLVVELAAPAAFIAPQLRILAATGAGIIALFFFHRRSEAAAERRHREVLAAISARKNGTDYIRGYVDGLARRTPEEQTV